MGLTRQTLYLLEQIEKLYFTKMKLERINECHLDKQQPTDLTDIMHVERFLKDYTERLHKAIREEVTNQIIGWERQMSNTEHMERLERHLAFQQNIIEEQRKELDTLKND